MRISLDWLSDYLPNSLSVAEVGERLTATGLEVEKSEVVDAVPGGLRGVVVGEVRSVRQHPNADRLRVTQVDVGAPEWLNIVCGAANVAEGQKVAVALVGAELYPAGSDKPLVIKKSALRGEPSEGMICAEDELGLGTDHSGIMVLRADASVGQPMAEYLGLESDHVVEVGLTPNRMDAMSHYGVARDLRASLLRDGQDVMWTEPTTADLSGVSGGATALRVEDSAACPQYGALKITGVNGTQASAEPIQQRLKAIGLNPINALVDATNYVMHALGHPLHCFDAAAVGGTVVVRRAAAGETLTTLDGVARTLHADDQVIANATAAMCLAGVYGGQTSGVSATTTAVVVESAWFDPVVTRAMARRHGLHTDASFRYERGVDPAMGLPALELFWTLVEAQFPEARIEGLDWVRANDPRFVAPTLEVSMDRIGRLLGERLPDDVCESILESLDIDVVAQKGDLWTLGLPVYRWDVRREADVAEELLRIWGFNNLAEPEGLRVRSQPEARLNSESLRRTAADYLVAQGLNEVMNLSLTRAAWFAEHPTIPASEVVHVLNPLSQDLGVMRPTLLYSGLETISYNLKRQEDRLAIFEFGRRYGQTAEGRYEASELGIWLCGAYPDAHYSRPNSTASFSVLKGLVGGLLTRLGIAYTEQPGDDVAGFWSGRLDLLGPKGEALVYMGWPDAHALAATDVDKPVLAALIQWDAVVAAAQNVRRAYVEPPKFPKVVRDLALVVPAGTTYGTLVAGLKSAPVKTLEGIELFDVYQGKGLPEGTMSYGVRLTFRDPSKTLQDQQVEGAVQRMLDGAKQHCGAVLR
ncbi:MAG: phenylalanine--tRNA ligase subunit beta [Schleiferiaceae bacterium]